MTRKHDHGTPSILAPSSPILAESSPAHRDDTAEENDEDEPPALDLEEATVRIENLERELEQVRIEKDQQVLDMDELKIKTTNFKAALDHDELPAFDFENGIMLANDVRNLINYHPPPIRDRTHYLRALLEDIRYIDRNDDNNSQRQILISHGLLALGTIIDDIIQGLEKKDYPLLMEYVLKALQEIPPIGLGRPALFLAIASIMESASATIELWDSTVINAIVEGVHGELSSWNGLDKVALAWLLSRGETVRDDWGDFVVGTESRSLAKVVEDLQEVKGAMYFTTVLRRPTVGGYLKDLGCTLIHVGEYLQQSITILRTKEGKEFIWTNQGKDVLLSTKGLEIQWTNLYTFGGPVSEVRAKSVGREWVKIDLRNTDKFGEYMYKHYSKEIIASVETASKLMKGAEAFLVAE